jgi:hypothetical protein
LHLGKALDQWRKIDARRPDHDPVLPITSALTIDPGVADDEASLLEFPLG